MNEFKFIADNSKSVIRFLTSLDGQYRHVCIDRWGSLEEHSHCTVHLVTDKTLEALKEVALQSADSYLIASTLFCVDEVLEIEV